MVRMILDIPNRFMNMPTEQLKGYFNNLAKVSGSVRTLFATTNNDVYDKSIKTVREGIFTDSICYQKEKNKMYVYDKILKDDLDIMEYHILKNKIISIKQRAENMNKSHHIQERKQKENER